MNGKKIHLPVVESTNLYTTELLSQSGTDEWTVVVADYQERGKGQRGRQWDSEPGENVLCSVVVRPKLQLRDQFLTSAATGLGIIGFLESLGVNASIKWPNDIMVGGKKIAGILIENQVKGNRVDHAVVGIGLNVNQVFFGTYNWPATSLCLELGRRFDVHTVTDALIESMQESFSLLIARRLGIMRAFNQHLYALGQRLAFDHNGTLLEGKLKGVGLDGSICIEMEGEEQSFFNGEIKLLHT